MHPCIAAYSTCIIFGERFSRRIHAREARNEDRDEKRTRDLLHHAYAACLSGEWRDVAEAGAREYRDAEVQSVGVNEMPRLTNDHEGLWIEIPHDRIDVGPQDADDEVS